MASLKASLISIRSEYERKKSDFAEAWISARRRILTSFTEASEALDNPKVEHENGTSSTLCYRSRSLMFKADERRLRVVRVRADEPDELYEPESLTQDKIEAEIRAFVKAVLEGA
jgi:hypothetical protein